MGKNTRSLPDRLANFGLEKKTEWAGNKTVCSNVKHLSRTDKQACFDNCQILGKDVYLNMNARLTQRNANTMIFGGSGTGKSRFYVKPNLLQMYGSYVITDPSGELLQTTGKALEQNGYKIKVLNVNNMAESMRYNPFAYVRSTKDIPSLVQVMISNIEGPKSGSGGDGKFWDLSTQALLAGICGYLFEARPMEERTFTNVTAMLRMIDMQQLSNDPNYESPLDRLFNDWDKKTNGQSYAVKQYKTFKMASDKTAGNILISTAVLFGKFFDLPEMANLTCTDEMELDMIGDEKTALFLIIPVGDPVYNFLTSVLISQMFRVLYQKGEEKMHRENSDNPSLKEHVTFILDEIANIGTIPNLDLYMSTVRKYNISIVPIFQAKSQLEADAYKVMAGNLIGNCDTLIFLGGTEKSTLDMLIERLGKRTIRNYNYSTSGNKKSGTSRSGQSLGRNLMDANEIMQMDDNYCIIFVRGQKPFKVLKYPYEKHPKYHMSGDADKKNTMTLKHFDMTDPNDPDLLVYKWQTFEHKNGKGETVCEFSVDEKGNRIPDIYADDYLDEHTVYPPEAAKDEKGNYLNAFGHVIVQNKGKWIAMNQAGQQIMGEPAEKFIGICIPCNGEYKMIPYSFPDPDDEDFKGQFKKRRTAKEKRMQQVIKAAPAQNVSMEPELQNTTEGQSVLSKEEQERRKEEISRSTTEHDKDLSDVLEQADDIGILNAEADYEFTGIPVADLEKKLEQFLQEASVENIMPVNAEIWKEMQEPENSNTEDSIPEFTDIMPF